MAISEDITVDAGEAIAEVNDLATAFEDLADKASAAMAKIDSALDGIGGGGAAAAGPDKLVAAWDKAADSVSAAADKIAQSIGRIGDIGAASSAAGPDKLAASWDDAAASISASVDKIAASGARIDDLGAGAAGAAGPVGDLGKALDDTAAGADKLAGAGAGAADGLKGIGDSAKESQAFLDEYNATLAETAAMAREASAASADASAKIAMSQRLNTAAMKDASDDAIAAQAAQADSAKQAGAAAEASATKYHLLALGGAAAIGYGIYKAAQLQTQVTRLYTTAGESQANLPADTAGILALSGATNTSQAQLAQGAYMISSAGFHGQSMLGILKAAAQGAQAEGAPLSETGNALTSLMNAYGVPKGQSTSQAAMSAMNEIITMVGQGKMTMAGAVGALPAVLPVASAAHISFPQVAGALATMTSMGMSPDWAAQNLRHTIGSLQNPNTVQTGEMQQLGLNPVSIAKNLGTTGLTGTLQEIQATVMKSMGPSGLVMMKTFNQSASAAQDATTMMKAMPPAIKSVAQGYLDGSVSAKQFQQEVFSGSESASQKNLLSQFATTANAAHGFNALLKSGQPDAQVYSAAMSKILGGTVGLQTALMLTGQHMSTFKANTDAVAQSASHAGDNVKGWGAVTQTLGFQLGSFEKTTQAVATEAGQIALPAVTGLMHGLSDVGSFLASNPGLTKPLVEGAGILGAVTVAGKVASAGTTALASVGKIAETLHIPGLSNLAKIGQGSGLDGAAAGLKGSATDLSGAAADLTEAAEKLSTTIPERNVPEPTTGTPGGPVSAAEQDAESGAGKGGLLDFGALASAANPIAAGIAGGLLLRGWSDSQAPKGTPAGTLNKDLYQQSFQNHPGNQMMNWEFGGLFSKIDMSSVGLSIGRAINDAINGIRAPASSATAAQSRFESRFGISPPGTPAAAPAAAPAEKVAPTVDMSALASAKSTAAQDAAGIGSALKSISSAPVKIGAPDLSALASAKGKAAQDADGIHTAVQTPLSKPVKATAPDLSAYAAAKAKAAADGANISAGLAAGILSEEGAVVAAANQVAAAATAAMAKAAQTHSPSKVTEATGKDVSAGLAKGITEGTGAVKASAVALSASTITSLTAGLQGGTSAINAALQAISGKGSRPQDITTIISTISTLKGDAAQALAAGQISKPEDSALVKMLNADNAKLQALAAKRTMLETEITDAQQITTQAISGASIMTAGAATPYDPSTVQSSYSLIQGQQYQADQARQFAQAVGQDKKLGLNSTELNQIIQSGAASGLPVAQGIAQGGKGTVTQLNALQSQIQSSAAKLGNEGAGPMYQAGVQAGQGVAAGIKSQLGAVDAAIKQMADSMVSEIKSALKSHSPSQVFAAEGLTIPQGLAQGVDQGTPIAQAAVSRMGNSLGGRLSPYHPGLAYGHPASGGSSGPQIVHNEVHMTIMGSVMTEHDLVSTVQNGLLKKGLNNWQAGLIPPGRAG